MIDYARAVEATVYSIGFQGQPAVFGGSAKGFLKKVADETGRAYFFPDKVGDLIRVFQAISEELKNHYLLAYSPKRSPDGSFRTISLKLPARPELQVRVRKGYFAVKRRPPAPKEERLTLLGQRRKSDRPCPLHVKVAALGLATVSRL